MLTVTRSPQSNRYCVPAALSALTGKSVDKLLPLITEYLGDQPITGMYVPIAVRILKDLGFKIRNVTPLDNTVSIKRLMNLHRKMDAPLLVEIYGHALVIDPACNRVIDSLYPQGCEIERYPARNARVQLVFEVRGNPRFAAEVVS